MICRTMLVFPTPSVFQFTSRWTYGFTGSSASTYRTRSVPRFTSFVSAYIRPTSRIVKTRTTCSMTLRRPSLVGSLDSSGAIPAWYWILFSKNPADTVTAARRSVCCVDDLARDGSKDLHGPGHHFDFHWR